MSKLNQFGMNKRLEELMQLVFISCNLFSDISKVDNGLLTIKTKNHSNYTQQECELVLRYFLDLIRSLSFEECHLIQDQSNPDNYYISSCRNIYVINKSK